MSINDHAPLTLSQRHLNTMETKRKIGCTLSQKNNDVWALFFFLNLSPGYRVPKKGMTDKNQNFVLLPSRLCPQTG